MIVTDSKHPVQQIDSDCLTMPVSSLPAVDKPTQLDDTVESSDVIIQPGSNDSK